MPEPDPHPRSLKPEMPPFNHGEGSRPSRKPATSSRPSRRDLERELREMTCLEENAIAKSVAEKSSGVFAILKLI
jgi:hypothetical protein